MWVAVGYEGSMMLLCNNENRAHGTCLGIGDLLQIAHGDRAPDEIVTVSRSSNKKIPDEIHHLGGGGTWGRRGGGVMGTLVGVRCAVGRPAPSSPTVGRLIRWKAMSKREATKNEG